MPEYFVIGRPNPDFEMPIIRFGASIRCFLACNFPPVVPMPQYNPNFGEYSFHNFCFPKPVFAFCSFGLTFCCEFCVEFASIRVLPIS